MDFGINSRRLGGFVMSKKGRPGRAGTNPTTFPGTVSPHFQVRHAVRLALGAMAALGTNPLRAELPVACVPGTCGDFVTSGAASFVTQGAAMTVQQNSAKAVLNWQSFNIGAGNS